jgi:hypothetical protein
MSEAAMLEDAEAAMLEDNDRAANSVHPLPLQGGGLGWGSTAQSETPTRLPKPRVAGLRQSTSPFQGEVALAGRAAAPIEVPIV